MPVPFEWMRRRPALLWLAVIAIGFGVAQLALIPLDAFLSWDEAIYAGQFAHGVQGTPPSPHRAPGMALLLAPVTVFTSSFVAVRAYLTVLLTVALFFAYRSWIPVNRWVAPVAALLFAVTADPLRLGHLALPNLPVALGSVAAVAFFVRTPDRGRSRGVLVGLIVMLGALAVLRPSDAVFLAAAMGAAVLLTKRWRRLDLLLAVPAGLAVGGLTWLVESFIRYGGPLERMTATRSITSASGEPLAVRWANAVISRASESPSQAVVAGVVALVVAVLLVLAVRKVCGGWPATTWLVTLIAALAMLVPYYVLLSFIANRYLVPAKALLAVVAAAALVRVVTAWPGLRRVVAAVCVTALVLMYAGTEVQEARKGTEYEIYVRDARELYAKRMAAHGIKPPCMTSGYQAPAYAYALGCRTGDNLTALPSKTNWHREFQRDWRTAQRENTRFVAVFISEKPPAAVADWERIKLGKTTPIYAYFPPTEE